MRRTIGARCRLTLNYGVRYEFFAPYTEKYGHLAVVATNPIGGFHQRRRKWRPAAGAFSGQLPGSLVFPFRTAFAPRVGLALRVPKFKTDGARAASA